MYSTYFVLMPGHVITYCYECQEWKPRYGYKRGNDETKEWLLEVPQNAGILF